VWILPAFSFYVGTAGLRAPLGSTNSPAELLLSSLWPLLLVQSFACSPTTLKSFQATFDRVATTTTTTTRKRNDCVAVGRQASPPAQPDNGANCAELNADW